MLDDSDHKDELLIRYLLNETSRTENEDLEDEMVLDESLAGRLQTVEMLLIDRYVLSELSAADGVRFEKGFLLFPENRAKVEDARIFHQSIDGLLNEEGLTMEKPATWFPPFLKRPSIQVPAFAVLALLLTGVIALAIYQNKRTREADKMAETPPNPKSLTPTPNENRSPNNDTVPAGIDHSRTASSSAPTPPAAPFRPRFTRPSTMLVERNGVTGQPSGQSNNIVSAQSLTIPQGSKTVTLNLKLETTKIVDPKRKIQVAILTEKLKPVAPGIERKVVPVRISNVVGPNRFMLSINVPASILKDNETYYFAIPSREPGGSSLTPFQISRTKN
ncbi:MAG: hypothetical protein QOH70_676 [Blastocatellia bacterium]|jgi:hypothetical protein|nr:hypothetical protein [Blastocatellia bacterium]